MSDSRTAIIRADQISKNIINDHQDNYILNNININIYDDDFTVIMGPSGAGKSTLLYVLSGMDKVSKGDIFYKNMNIVDMNEDEIAILRSKEFGFVFQQTHLVSYLTLYENILAAGYTNNQNKSQEIIKRTNQLLENMHISNVKDHLPSQVSGGEAQRAAIARAMINRPGIIFADEPTGALNKSNSEQVLDLLTQMHQDGQCILMVTHDVHAAMRGTRLIYIEDGKVVGERKLTPYQSEGAKQREADIQRWLASMEW